MNTTSHTTTTRSARRSGHGRRARLVGASLAALAVLAVASPAAAQKPRKGSTPASCDMEVDGKTVQVTEGSRAGMFVCGADGEWHFGWLINARVGGSTKDAGPTLTAAGFRRR